MPSWPTQSDYKDSLQNPDTAFRDPDLRQSQAERSPMGVPRARSGAFASVYKMTGPKGTVALKLFNFPNEDRARRYKAVSDYLEQTLGANKPPCLVKFQYHAEGMRVGKLWYPTLTMAWVKGVSLGEWVRQTVERKVPDLAALRKMTESWVALVQQLQTAKIAHGDLQHDNVMVVNDAPVLVDYDGMCVPSLDPTDPAKKLEQLEFGKPAYQHPARAVEKLSANLDNFSAWVILVALRAIVAEPQLYVKYVLKTDNENLLFTPQDMQTPADSQLWPELMRSKDADVREWSRALRESLDKPFAKIPNFALDPFDKLRKLISATPRDWAQIEAETERLKLAGKTLPSDIKDKVNPVGGLKELCDAPVKNWPAIAAEGTRLLASGKVFPPEVRRVYDDAAKRVSARDAVQKAIDERNPRAIVAAYQPTLLDTWAEPALLTAARAATGQVTLLDKLKAASTAPGDGREFARLCEEAAPKLAGIAEANTYVLSGKSWRSRIAAADGFLRAFNKSPQTERELADAWQAVVAAGTPHPSLNDTHRKRGENAIRWSPLLDKLRRVPAIASCDNDNTMVTAWGSDSVLAGCAEASVYRSRVEEARKRLSLVNELTRAIQQADAGGSEDAVVSAAAKLPPGYQHPHTTRVGEGSEAITLMSAIQNALAVPDPSDRKVANAFDILKQRNPKLAARLNKVNPQLYKDVEACVSRRKLLDTFAKIDREESRIDKQDKKWLALWVEHGKQLNHRSDREELRDRLTLARDRLTKWREIAESLKARDMFTLRKRFHAYRDTLAKYPPLQDRISEIQALLAKADRVIAIRDKIAASQPLAADDMQFLRENHNAFDAETKTTIESQVRARLAGDAKLVPAYPAYTITGKRGGLVKACWSWSGHGLISHCVVAVDGRRFLNDPNEADPYSRLTCLAENHQREGGGVTLVPPSGAAQAYVCIWPVVELGWKSITGPPLTIGPVTLGVASLKG